jgi:phosphoribosylamine---glycine ligase
LKVLIIGSGGREHALASAFTASPKVSSITVAPGNAGIAKEFTTLPLMGNISILNYCLANQPDMVFIGPEQPLADGLGDLLRHHDVPCVGPSQAAARIETSKIFAKKLMQRYGIPSASFFHTHDRKQALMYIDKNTVYPLVLKADGLSAGKGVIIAMDADEARQALSVLMPEDSIGQDKGIVIEEYMEGWEVSLFAVTDSVSYCTTLFSQDHKQLLDGDKGPNTGGMGAFAPVDAAEPWRSEIEEKIIGPVLQAMRNEDCPFSGILYCGLMITQQGPKVVEFNCRFGDPEAQALLPLLKTDMFDLCSAINDKRVGTLKLDWSNDSTVAVVLASKGYPGSYEWGQIIHLPASTESKIFFSGVSETGDALLTAGGRVLCVCGKGKDIATAREQAYADIAHIEFTGKTFRNDIALRNNTL